MAKKAFVYDGSQWVDIAQSTADLSNVLPAGIVSPYAGSVAPTGYLLCDGSAINRTDYSRLFSAIGTAYGVGNGSTTFNLPDLRGRVIAALDNMGGTDAGRLSLANTLGTTAGTQTHTLTTSEIPSHTHPITDPGHAHAQNGTAAANFAGSGGLQGTQTTTPMVIQSNTTGITVNGQSGTTGQAHNIMQPTILMNYIIKV